MAQTVKTLPTMQETWIQSLGGEDPLEKGMATHSSILAGEIPCHLFGLPWWLSSKESACNAENTGEVGSIPGSGRSCGEGNGNPLQYSCRENAMVRGV